MPNLRRKVASKAGKVIKKLSQEVAPKMVDEGPPTGAPPVEKPKLDEQKVEEEVEEQIAEEKEEAKLETVDDKLDKLMSQMETVVNALEDHKKINSL